LVYHHNDTEHGRNKVYSPVPSKANTSFKMKHYLVQGFSLIKFLHKRNTF